MTAVAKTTAPWSDQRAVVGGASLLLTLFLTSSGLAVPEPSATPFAVRLTVADAIGPATADYVERGLDTAASGGAYLVLLRIDTPGGLDASMRNIIRKIIASPVPVVAYVAPSGARAASAGTYILYSAHVAAMAPATNIGAATPVQLGGLPALPSPRGRSRPDSEPEPEPDAAPAAEDETEGLPSTQPDGDAMTRKLVNDAVAYLRGLARLRGRNEHWAERAVRDGASLTAEDALEAKVIDLVAVDETRLLAQLDGRVVHVLGTDITLATDELVIDDLAPDWRTELLAVITNPNVAYVLMLLGIYGLFFELSNPGAVVPGVVGSICLVVAMFALQMLPVNYAGLALIVLGIAFMIGELFVPSFGALGVGGVVAFAVGSVVLFDSDTGQFRVSWPIIVAVTALSAAFFLLAIRALLRARQGPVVSGREELIGARGHALEDFAGDGQVRVHGEIWKARAGTAIKRGDAVQVTAVDGLTLTINPAPKDTP